MPRISEAFVDIRPESSGFRNEARRAIESAMAGVKAAVALVADSGALRNDARRAATAAGAGLKVDVGLSTAAGGLRAEMRRAAAEASAGVRANIELIAEGSVGLARGIRAAVRDASAGERADIPVHAESRGLREEVSRASAVASVGQRIEVPINIDAGRFASLDTFFGSISGGIGEISALGTVLGALRLGEVASGALLAASGLVAMAAAAVEVASALAPLAGLVGALPGLLAAAGQGFGVLKLATGGIAEALKAYSTQQGQAGASAASAARSAATAARTQEAAAESVRSATDALARAQRAVGEDAERAADRVAAANDRMGAAERTLVGALRGEKEAQDRLAQARRDASEQLEDQILTVARASLSEKQARLAIDEARKRQADVAANAKSTSLERRAAALDVADAELTLKEVVERRADDEAKLNDLQRKGVNGADGVVAAQQNLADATQSVADAQKGMVDAAREVSRAYRDQAISAADSAKAVSDASHALDLALRRASEASDELDSGTASVDRFAEALAKLPPAAQDFVRELLTFKPALEGLRQTAAANLFPPLTEGLERIRSLLPTVDAAVAGTARQLGLLGRSFAELVTSPAFRTDLAAVMATNTTLIGKFGVAGLSMVDAFRHITVAAIPLTSGLADLAVRMSETFRGAAEAGRQSGALAAFFDKTAAATERLVSIVGSLGRILADVGHAAFPFGDQLVAGFDRGLKAAAEFTHSLGGQSALTEFFASFAPILSSIGNLFATAAAQGVPLIAMLSGKGVVGAGLVTILDAVSRNLGSVRTILEGLGTVAGAFGGALGKALDIAAPALARLATTVAPVVASLMTTIGPALGSLVAQVAPVLGKLVAAAGPALEKLLTALGPAIGAIATASAPAADILGTVGDLLAQLAPILADVFAAAAPVLTEILRISGASLTALLPALKPIIPVLQDLGRQITPVLAGLAPVFVQLAASLGGALAAAAPMLAALALSVVKLLAALIPLLPPVAELAKSFFEKLLPALTPLLPEIVDLAGSFLKTLLPAVVKLLPPLIDFIAKIVDGLVPVIPTLTPLLVDMAKDLGDILVALLPVLPPLADLLVALTPLIPLLTIMLDLFVRISPVLVPVIAKFAQLAAIILEVAVPAIRLLLKIFLDVVGGILGAAERMFGWVPGLGGKLKGAAKDFDEFKNGVNASLDAIQDKNVDLTLTAHLPDDSLANGVHSDTGRGTNYAQGAIVDYYARGGMRENHIAQIAPAGAWRVWAEDETGGEAYIPLAMSKRARSEAIVGEVAKRFGMTVTKHADGDLLDFRQYLPNVGLIDASARDAFNRMAEAATAAARQSLQEQLASSGGTPGGGSSAPGDLDSWIDQALDLTGHPRSWHDGIRARAIQESGGDPGAQNNWDSNAVAGTPSKGVMQVIDPTFESYKAPGHDDIWNPVDNIAAAINYIAARYGDPYSLPAGGYRDGGLIESVRALIPALSGAVHRESFDTGGTLEPGWNRVYNGLGRREGLVPAGGDGGDFAEHLAEVLAARMASVLDSRPLQVQTQVDLDGKGVGTGTARYSAAEVRSARRARSRT